MKKTEADVEEIASDAIRELVNSARQNDKARYKTTLKTIKRMSKESEVAKNFIKQTLKGVK
jgi:hypothetical protein